MAILRSSDSLAASSEINRSPLCDQVYELLRANIVKGNFAQGQQLSLQELSARYQLSVTPIRDALRRLEADGLVQVSPRRGTYISRFTAQDVQEVFEGRRIIEQAAAEKLPTAPEATIRRMVEIGDAMATLIDGDVVSDYPAYLHLDEELHRCIVEILNNSRLSDMYHGLRAHTYIARALVPAAERRIPETHEEHRQIIDAFRRRDVERAKQAVANHLQHSTMDILRKMQDLPVGANP